MAPFKHTRSKKNNRSRGSGKDKVAETAAGHENGKKKQTSNYNIGKFDVAEVRRRSKRLNAIPKTVRKGVNHSPIITISHDANDERETVEDGSTPTLPTLVIPRTNSTTANQTLDPATTSARSSAMLSKCLVPSNTTHQRMASHSKVTTSTSGISTSHTISVSALSKGTDIKGYHTIINIKANDDEHGRKTQWVFALLDSGSSDSLIFENKLRSFGFPFVHSKGATGPAQLDGQKVPCVGLQTLYFSFKGKTEIHSMQLRVLQDTRPQYDKGPDWDVLIGRDFLANKNVLQPNLDVVSEIFYCKVHSEK